jgi:hypothetical protein
MQTMRKTCHSADGGRKTPGALVFTPEPQATPPEAAEAAATP